MNDEYEYDSDFEENENEKDLDTSWIKEFESSDKSYELFYKNDVHYINTYFVYVNSKNNDIVYTKKHTFFMKIPNYVSREEILQMLKRNSELGNKKYSILSILKYNIDIEPLNIKDFILHDNNENDNFFTVVKNIDAIPFNKSIAFLNNLNSLYFIFYEKDTHNKNTYSNTSANHSVTKRVYMRPSSGHKKTIRK